VVEGIWGVCVFAFGTLALVVWYFPPPPSDPALRLGLGLALVSTGAAMWSWKTYNWWARVAGAGAWTLMFLAIAARSWAFLLPSAWPWAPPVLIGYSLAWALPALAPRLSGFLRRDQTTPRTRLGRILLALGLGIAPVAGALGAIAGMHTHALMVCLRPPWLRASCCLWARWWPRSQSPTRCGLTARGQARPGRRRLPPRRSSRPWISAFSS